MKRRTVAEKTERMLAMPIGVLSAVSRMELSGNRRVLIEGCRGIVRYNEDAIELRTLDGAVRFTGRELCMTNLNPSCAVITGRFVSIEFL